jgi:hypothetical protein
MQDQAQARWDAERAWAWRRQQGWLCGFNYVPATAVNTTEMWQAETFDAATIERELAWAEHIGFNSLRAFVQYLVWESDPAGLAQRMNQFLSIAARHHIRVMFCLFDDCAFAGKQPYLGRQDDPVPGVHNSAWTPSPGHARVTDQACWPDLARYVTALISSFAGDSRVIAWDLYNEPGNAGMGARSLPLMLAAFGWAHAARPEQPITVGLWTDAFPEFHQAQLEWSDIITFHNYNNLPDLERQIAALKLLGRPVVCTEWMRRPHSLYETHLPVFKREDTGCYAWGLVKGRTQTYYPWGSPAGAPEPAVWFHDVLHPDGQAYHDEEVNIIRELSCPRTTSHG